MRKPIALLLALLTLIGIVFCWAGPLTIPSITTWRGLKVVPEYRCSPYNRRSDYPHYPEVEQQIIQAMGGKIYAPYTKQYFQNQRQVDIEHIVATSEAHDSGLCAKSQEIKKQFAMDLLNLTLADPQINRYQKRDKDAGQWLPPHNKCWFAGKVLAVKSKYQLTIDKKEAFALENILSQCESTAMNMQ